MYSWNFATAVRVYLCRACDILEAISSSLPIRKPLKGTGQSKGLVARHLRRELVVDLQRPGRQAQKIPSEQKASRSRVSHQSATTPPSNRPLQPKASKPPAFNTRQAYCCTHTHSACAEQMVAREDIISGALLAHSMQPCMQQRA
jgi:hypothetical protein